MNEGAWTLTTDVPPSVGGTNAWPSPGVYGRAAVASCIAIGIKLMAAKVGHPIESVNVELDADYDWRGDFGLDSVPPGFQRFRLRIRAESPGDTDATEKIVREALHLSSWLTTLAQEQIVSAELAIVGSLEPRSVTVQV